MFQWSLLFQYTDVILDNKVYFYAKYPVFDNHIWEIMAKNVY